MTESFRYNHHNLELTMSKKMIGLSFDDACNTQRHFAVPLIQKLGFGATFFVCEFWDAFHTNHQQYMTWQEIKEIQDMGLEIGNHTLTHSQTVKDMTEEEFLVELRALNKVAKLHGVTGMTGFGYPGGPAVASFDVKGCLRREGFRYARAVGPKPYVPGESDIYELPCFPVNAPDLAPLQQAVATAGDNSFPILVYHGVPDLLHPWAGTPEDVFKAGMEWLAQQDCQVVALRDLPGLG